MNSPQVKSVRHDHPTRYFDLVREMKNAYNHHLRLVESAGQRAIKPTVRLFITTVSTVRKWLRRYQQQGPSGLVVSPIAHSRMMDRRDLHDKPSCSVVALTLQEE